MGGGLRIPIGVYDHPTDGTIPVIKSTSVGDNFPSTLGRKATSVRDDLARILDTLNPLP